MISQKKSEFSKKLKQKKSDSSFVQSKYFKNFYFCKSNLIKFYIATKLELYFPFSFFNFPIGQMNNSTSRLTFTASDGIYISLQFLIYLFTIFIFILLLLFRKEKELKHRGFLPYFSTIGTVLLSFRFIVSNLSFLKLGNDESIIHK
jgi:hypothetical protein